jgi:hypothetical protein
MTLKGSLRSHATSKVVRRMSSNRAEVGCFVFLSTSFTSDQGLLVQSSDSRLLSKDWSRE